MWGASAPWPAATQTRSSTRQAGAASQPSSLPAQPASVGAVLLLHAGPGSSSSTGGAQSPRPLCRAAQVAQAARAPWSSWLATPAASWLDDFLTWASPEIPQASSGRASGQHIHCSTPDMLCLIVTTAPPAATRFQRHRHAPAACASSPCCSAAARTQTARAARRPTSRPAPTRPMPAPTARHALRPQTCRGGGPTCSSSRWGVGCVPQRAALAVACLLCIGPGRHSLHPSSARTTATPQDKLPWFLDSLPSAACAKGGAGAYTDAIQARRRHLHPYACRRSSSIGSKPAYVLWNAVCMSPPPPPVPHHHPPVQMDAGDPTGVAGLGSEGVVAASSFRANYVTLSRQADFIAALEASRHLRSRHTAGGKLRAGCLPPALRPAPPHPSHQSDPPCPPASLPPCHAGRARLHRVCLGAAGPAPASLLGLPHLLRAVPHHRRRGAHAAGLGCARRRRRPGVRLPHSTAATRPPFAALPRHTPSHPTTPATTHAHAAHTPTPAHAPPPMRPLQPAWPSSSSAWSPRAAPGAPP